MDFLKKFFNKNENNDPNRKRFSGYNKIPTQQIKELEFKIIVIGGNCTGKSSLIRRFCLNLFSASYQPTIGYQFFLKKILIN
jgi:GTPase SAR1 family protein